MIEDPALHRGGCHCGRVRFTVRAPPTLDVLECNCSICRMTGYLHLIVRAEDFTLEQGADAIRGRRDQEPAGRLSVRQQDAKRLGDVSGPGDVPGQVGEVAARASRHMPCLRELGRTQLPIPHPVAKPLLGTLWRFGASSFPVPELDFIRYVCMVDGRRAAAELGFRPRFGLRETIHAAEDPA